MNEDFLKIIGIIKFFDGIYLTDDVFLCDGDDTIYLEVFDKSTLLTYYFYYNDATLNKTKFLPQGAALITRDLVSRIQIFNS